MKNFFYTLIASLALTFSASTQIVDSLNQSLTQTDSRLEKGKILIALGEVFAKKGQPDSTIYFLERAENIINENDSIAITLYRGFMRAYYLNGNFKKGFEYAKLFEATLQDQYADISAIDAMFAAKFKIAIGFTIYGELYRKIGDYEEALDYALKARTIAALNNDSVLLASNYNNLGIIHNRLGQYEQAKSNYIKALNLNKNLPTNQAGLASNYNNLGLLYRTSKSYDSALYSFKLALDNIKSPYGIATIVGNMGTIHFDLNAYDSALYYHKKALGLQEENGYKEQASLSRINIGGVYRAMKKYAQSTAILEEAYAFNEQQQNLDLLKKASEVLANVYEDSGDFSKSLFYHRKFKMHHDSIFNQNKNKEIIKHQLKFDLLEKEKELEVLEQQSALNAAKARFQVVVSVILGIVILLIGFLFYSILKRKKIKQALIQQELINQENERQFLEKELDFKNKELVNFALQIVEKNNFILKFEEDIHHLSKNGLKGNEQVVNLVKKLKTSNIINKHQREFDAHVNSVNSSFYQKLEENYPGLTQNEKRLTALLRLQLSSKEISSIVGISPKSVDMNRYRLRKKLNLETEENLISVLNNL